LVSDGLQQPGSKGLIAYQLAWGTSLDRCNREREETMKMVEDDGSPLPWPIGLKSDRQGVQGSARKKLAGIDCLHQNINQSGEVLVRLWEVHMAMLDEWLQRLLGWRRSQLHLDKNVGRGLREDFVRTTGNS
jgi:hypothetical protein